METFSTRLKNMRLEAKLSLKEMAGRLKVPVTTYREWEYGRTIRGQPYVRMAEILEVSVVELLTGKKPSRQGVFKELEAVDRHLSALRKELESFLSNE